MPNLIVVAAFKRDEEGQLLSAFEPLQMQSEGAKGGKKRAANLTPARRKEIAQEAAEKRWNKDR